MRIFSFGGGVQSTAVMVLAAQGRVQYDAFVFSNVGDDSEHPDTLDYIRYVSRPYAEQHGLNLVEIRRTYADGRPYKTLREYILSSKTTIPIPAYMQSGAPGSRTCTVEWKIEVIARYTKRAGATPIAPATVGIGISMDEYQRMKDSRIKWQVHEFPLIDLRMSRRECLQVIAEAGLPQPPKSSCYFCPYHSRDAWRRMRQERPDLFADAVELEKQMNATRAGLGKDEVYLTSTLKPLEQAVIDQPLLFGDAEMCDSGYCWT